MRRFLIAAVMLGSTVACAPDAEEVPAEVQTQRQRAARLACFSEELANRMADDVQMLESSFGGASQEAGSPNGVLSFARALHQHAVLRHGAYTLTDSAVNHAGSTADSLRYAQRAEQFTISAPTPRTVEANVIESYQQQLSTLLADEDHPCNWKHELETESNR